MRRYLALLVIGALAGCTPQTREIVNDVAPAVLSAVEIAVPGSVPILTEAERLACSAQKQANATQPPTPTSSAISAEAGAACTW